MVNVVLALYSVYGHKTSAGSQTLSHQTSPPTRTFYGVYITRGRASAI